jgi:hypothetical protein
MSLLFQEEHRPSSLSEDSIEELLMLEGFVRELPPAETFAPCASSDEVSLFERVGVETATSSDNSWIGSPQARNIAAPKPSQPVSCIEPSPSERTVPENASQKLSGEIIGIGTMSVTSTKASTSVQQTGSAAIDLKPSFPMARESTIVGTKWPSATGKNREPSPTQKPREQGNSSHSVVPSIPTNKTSDQSESRILVRFLFF